MNNNNYENDNDNGNGNENEVRKLKLFLKNMKKFMRYGKKLKERGEIDEKYKKFF